MRLLQIWFSCKYLDLQIVTPPISQPMSWWSGDLQTCGKMTMKESMVCDTDINWFPISLYMILEEMNAQHINQISLKKHSPAFILVAKVDLRVGDWLLSIFPSTFSGYFSIVIAGFKNMKCPLSSPLASPNIDKPLPLLKFRWNTAPLNERLTQLPQLLPKS